MAVFIDANHSAMERPSATKWPFRHSGMPSQESAKHCITIGVINNMPDGALQATERQFSRLLHAASPGVQVRLLFFALRGIPRANLAASYVETHYYSTDALRHTHLDGLIVTGREPVTPRLEDEPYWESFAGVVDWARENTCSAVWSCLAAHGAVLHNDSIERVRSQEKHCGIFECARVSDHALTADAPPQFKLPHSRWNGVPEEMLARCGYNVLTRNGSAGVDTFVKQYRSLFVFFQGHPEYEWDSLLLEYRRDVGRFFRGEAKIYPPAPAGYFDEGTATALDELRQESMRGAREDVFASVSTVLAKVRVENAWKSTATCIYRNWLQYICMQKQVKMPGIHTVTGVNPLEAGLVAANPATPVPVPMLP